MSDIVEYYRKNNNARMELAKEAVRYSIDKAIDRAEKITPFVERYERRDPNTNVVVEKWEKVGVEIALKKPELANERAEVRIRRIIDSR